MIAVRSEAIPNVSEVKTVLVFNYYLQSLEYVLPVLERYSCQNISQDLTREYYKLQQRMVGAVQDSAK